MSNTLLTEQSMCMMLSCLVCFTERKLLWGTVLMLKKANLVKQRRSITETYNISTVSGMVLGHGLFEQKNGPLTNEIAILNLERIAH